MKPFLARKLARLNTENGIKLSTPGFNRFDQAKGGVTTYPPGAKENGGIFCHANAWAIAAAAHKAHTTHMASTARRIVWVLREIGSG